MVETCTRTIHGRPLLRPGPEANERILGVLGRAAEYYHVEVFAFGIASNHYHLLYRAEHGLQMSRFQGYLNSNLGYWFNRTKEWKARRRGEDFQKYDYETRYELELLPVPAFARVAE